jgi:hypothetical protein
MTTVIDSDQHLVEYRGMWAEHIDPQHRDGALEMVDDDAGWTWMSWRGQRLGLVDIQAPGDTGSIGDRAQAAKRGDPCQQRWGDVLPDDHWNPSARRDVLARLGVDEAVLFPNFGLLWERKIQSDPVSQMANMAAWNRWAAIVAREGGGALHPVAHLHLRDDAWLERELRALADADVRLAMVAPALVDGKPMSHPDFERGWSLFEHYGVAPVFHVADQPRPFDDAWYTDADQGFPTVESVFIWTAAALACTDLIVNGVFERHPDLRLGIVELSAIWVPQFLLMFDGGVRFTSKLNGKSPGGMRRAPSEYFHDHVRVSSFSYELPMRITRELRGADILMACSDYPHSEGTATPLADYAGTGKFATTPETAPGLFHDNAAWLLGKA